jgi:hypothetical protein
LSKNLRHFCNLQRPAPSKLRPNGRKFAQSGHSGCHLPDRLCRQTRQRIDLNPLSGFFFYSAICATVVNISHFYSFVSLLLVLRIRVRSPLFHLLFIHPKSARHAKAWPSYTSPIRCSFLIPQPLVVYINHPPLLKYINFETNLVLLHST